MMATNPRPKKARPRVAGLDRGGRPIDADTTAEQASATGPASPDSVPATGAGQDEPTRATSSAAGTSATRSALTTTRSKSPWTLAIWLGVAALVLAIIAIIGALHPGASIGKNKAFIDEAATTELTSQAGSKACNVLAYDGTEFDKWAAKARSALTGKPLKEFNEYLPTQKQLIEQTKAVADCKVDGVGVMELTGGGEGDKAHVIMNLVISQSLNGIAANSGAKAMPGSSRSSIRSTRCPDVLLIFHQSCCFA
jgi:Mce-associated membrane protein